MHRAKAPEIVKTHDVISVRMGVHNCIDSGDIFPQCLNAKFGAGIDDPAEIVGLNVYGGTHPIISRILRPADRTIAANRRNSHRCTGAEESDRKHSVKRASRYAKNVALRAAFTKNSGRGIGACFLLERNPTHLRTLNSLVPLVEWP